MLPWFMLLFNSKALLSQWKPPDAAENFNMYQNLQPHRAVLPAIAWHLVIVLYCTVVWWYQVMSRDKNVVGAAAVTCAAVPLCDLQLISCIAGAALILRSERRRVIKPVLSCTLQMYTDLFVFHALYWYALTPLGQWEKRPSPRRTPGTILPTWGQNVFWKVFPIT